MFLEAARPISQANVIQKFKSFLQLGSRFLNAKDEEAFEADNTKLGRITDGGIAHTERLIARILASEEVSEERQKETLADLVEGNHRFYVAEKYV